MVLRKPYALLIKYFRIIHGLLFTMLCYVLYSTINISSFFSLVVSDNSSVLGTEIVNKYIGFGLKVIPILIIMLFIIILWLLIFKKKETKDYTISIVLLIVAYIILYSSFGVLSELEITILEIRFLKLIRDLIIISCILQAYPIILTFIRFTGFDIKKFDFEKDLVELNISETDREEFEVDFNVNTDLYKRKFNKSRRLLKYFCKENKKIIIIISSIIVLSTSYVIYINVYRENENIKYNEIFYLNNATYKIKNSYVANTDYRGNEVDKNYNYVILKVEAKTGSKKKIKIKPAYFELIIYGHVFNAENDHSKEFNDLGIVYSNTDLKEKYNEYIFVYKIPKLYSKANMKLRIIKFFDNSFMKNVTNYYYLTLNNINLLKDKEFNNVYLKEKMSFDDYIMKDSNLIINNYKISPKFEIKYNFKTNNNIVPSLSYAQARYIGSYDKTLLRIEYDYNSNGVYDDLFSLIGNTGYLHYSNNTLTTFTKITPKVIEKGVLYLEVPSDITESKNLSLKFNIRGIKYTYVLKEEK